MALAVDAEPAVAGGIGRGRELFWRYAPALVCLYAYLVISLGQFRRYHSGSWDLGIFEEAIRGYAHLRAPVVDIKGPGFNLLGDHFHPILMLLAPVYRLFPGAATLLVAQAVLFAVSVVPVTRLGIERLGTAYGVAVGLAYGISWGIQNAIAFDFHEIAFAMPIIAMAMCALARRRWLAAVLWAGTLVFVKEDLTLTAAAVGLYVLLIRPAEGEEPRVRRLLGAVLVLWSAVWLTAALYWIIPAFNPQHRYPYWNKLETGAGAGALLAAPLRLLWPFVKIRTLFTTLLPTGLLAACSPLAAIAVPTLAWRFVSREQSYWGTWWHYSAVLMPILFVAMIDAVERLRTRGPRWLRGYAPHVPAIALAVCVAITPQYPFHALITPDAYRAGPDAASARRVLATIPSGATVEADVDPMAHLTSRTRVFWLGQTGGLAPGYIAIHAGAWPDGPKDLVGYARQLHPAANYRIQAEDGGWVVLARR